MSKLQVSIYKGAAAKGVRISREEANEIADHLDGGFIIIPKSETCDGEVTEFPATRNVVAGSGPERAEGSLDANPNWLRNRAINLLSIADYIENRDAILAAKEAEAAAARDKRRDELARELSPLGFWTYAAHNKSTQKAIDRIIDLESAA